MITVTILTKNSAETLEMTLHSVADFPEVIVLDTGSTDATLEIAGRFANARIHHSPFIGFGPLHNLATTLASNDWILSLDSDEILSKEARHELLTLKPTPGAAYALLRHNYFNGKWIKGCAGWHPDWVVRLYNRNETHFSDAQVHETVLTDHLHQKRLQGPIKHTPYRSMEDFLKKMHSYSHLFALQNQHKKPPSLLTALLRSLWAFLKSYLLKKGFLAGREGLIISLYNSHCTYYKYLLLLEHTNTSKQDGLKSTPPPSHRSGETG